MANEIYVRDGFGYRNYFNAGINRETCVCDEEGVDVFDSHGDNNYYIGSIPWKSVDDIKDMTDEELAELLAENGIF